MTLFLSLMLFIPFLIKTESNNAIWIALIGAASGILGMLGINEIVPAIIKWFKEKREEKRKNKESTIERYEKILKERKLEYEKNIEERKLEYEKLKERIDKLDRKLDRAERFESQTRSTLNAMLPLMKEMMKEHPAYVSLLQQLENNIMGEVNINNTTSSSGT